MLRASTLCGLAAALTFGGAAAMAQQASDKAGASGDTSPGPGAPASQATGIKGVYSLKSTMGISTGQTPGEDADASAADKSSGRQKEKGGAPSD